MIGLGGLKAMTGGMLNINMGIGGGFGMPQLKRMLFPSVGLRIPGGMKHLFFDRALVKNSLDTASYHALLRFGQYVRGTAKRIMTAGRSSYGRAPHSPSLRHQQWGMAVNQQALLKRFTFYGYDPARRSVVIGPELMRGRMLGFGPYGDVTVPELLEYGGTVTMTRSSARRLGRPEGSTATYPAMPYMGPAFEAGMAKLKGFYKDSMVKYSRAA